MPSFSFCFKLDERVVYVAVDRLALVAAARCCRLLFQRGLKRLLLGNVWGVFRWAHGRKLTWFRILGLPKEVPSVASHPKNEQDIAFAFHIHTFHVSFLYAFYLICVDVLYVVTAHVTSPLFFVFFFLTKISWPEEKQVAGTTSSFQIMKPDSRLEPTHSLLNCICTQKHSAVSTFGSVCLGSSLGMWAKGHAPSLWVCQEFYFLSPQPPLSLLSLPDCSTVSAFVARAGQDGGHFDKYPETEPKFRLSLSS